MKRAVLVLAAVFLLGSQPGRVQAVPRPEHPRPDLMRDSWQNLNGEWGFAFDPADVGLEEKWFEREKLPGRIMVPYPVQSELSGVNDPDPPAVCWYVKKFDLDPALGGRGKSLLLHFGAVDYQAKVWLNGRKLGEHTGGYTPFQFEVSGMARPRGNVLVVRVYDALDRMQVRGKQSPTGKPYTIMYTPVTGIWQTVWIERAGRTYLKSFRFTPAADLSGGRFSLEVEQPDQDAAHLAAPLPRQAGEWSAEITITGPDKSVDKVRGRGGALEWRTRHPRPWSPDDPVLYQVEIALFDRGGALLDRVKSYVGIRTITTGNGRIYLNGKEFYQKLLLDQGYFPGGWYAPADDEAMRADLAMYKRMGFNGLRKHQKVEDPRFLYWCDKLGLVVWEEMPSLGFGLPRPVPARAMARFRDEWLEVIGRDYNHPCIITWTVYNENWGIYEMLWRGRSRRWAFEMVRRTREADPTRLVVDNSGGWHFDTDVWDFHHYLPTVEDSERLYRDYHFQPGDHVGLGRSLLGMLKGKLVFPAFFPGVDYQGQPLVLSEYGGFGFYKTKGGQSLLEKYRAYTMAVGRFPYIAGYCYTQPYDVEQERNGLMTFERVPKVAPEKIKQINDAVGRE